jgi:hypothetical protein
MSMSEHKQELKPFDQENDGGYWKFRFEESVNLNGGPTREIEFAV